MEWAALCGLASTLRLTRSLDLTSRYAIVSYFSLPRRSSPPSKTSHPLFFFYALISPNPSSSIFPEEKYLRHIRQ